MVVLLLGCARESGPGSGVPSPAEAGSPIAGLSDEWTRRFEAGQARFEHTFTEADGLGPAYIRPACTGCHADAARGPAGQTRMVVTESDGVTPSADQSGLPWGSLVRPYTAAGASTGVTVPDDVPDLLVTNRVGPALFARGYIDAVDPTELDRVEAEEATDGLVSGRVNRVAWDGPIAPDARFYSAPDGDLAGRFGMKASSPTLDAFVAGALLGDSAITSPLRPDELPNPDGLTDDDAPGIDIDADAVYELSDYVRLLAIPERDSPDDGGAELFDAIGCASCHVPTLHTRADYPVPQLADIDAPLYSDLLLHDRGVDLADGIVEGEATGREWRTAPLIGLRFLGSYTHDGRALTLADAIDTHAADGSESTFAVENFHTLSDANQETLLDWLATL